MVQIKELINPSILNSEWVGFNGDSEFVDSKGKLQMGNWSFLRIVEDLEAPFTIQNEIAEEYIFGNDNCVIVVKNANGNHCEIQLHYIHCDCESCRHNYKSYHCIGCNNYYGSEDDLEPLCNYCDNTPYEDGCDNCVWNFEM